MEVELVVRIENPVSIPGEIAISARKLLDICRALPAESNIALDASDGKAVLRSGKSRFTLMTMTGSEFPSVGAFDTEVERELAPEGLRRLFGRTDFAMAYQDVRYYLNGLLLEFAENHVRAVATDGHRLALADLAVDEAFEQIRRVIVPRKGVAEMARLLATATEAVQLKVGTNHIKLSAGNQELTSKLIDGRFPEYERVIPRGGSSVVTADKLLLKDCLSRAAILSNEKFRGVRLVLSTGGLRALAHNPNHEEAEEEMEVEYRGQPMEVGFNVTYLIDVLSVISAASVRLEFTDANNSCLIKDVEDETCRYVVMPMRL
jgi:DNA polymerase-3 subunit beta